MPVLDPACLRVACIRVFACVLVGGDRDTGVRVVLRARPLNALERSKAADSLCLGASPSLFVCVCVCACAKAAKSLYDAGWGYVRSRAFRIKKVLTSFTSVCSIVFLACRDTIIVEFDKIHFPIILVHGGVFAYSSLTINTLLDPVLV